MISRLIKRPLAAISFLSAFEGLVVLAVIVLTPSDGKNSVLAGFSFQRLALLAIVLIITAGFFVAGWIFGKDQKWGQKLNALFLDEKKSRIILGITTIVGFGLLNLLLLPDYRWGNNVFIFNRTRPAILWAGVICIQIGLSILATMYQAHPGTIKAYWVRQRSGIILPVSLLIFFLCIWAWMAWSGMGIFPDTTFWNDPGVPLLIFQVYLAVVLGWIVYLVEQGSNKHSKDYFIKVDWGLCILIFLTAAILWNLTPQKSTVFAPGPYPPNDTFYPHSDAEVYNLSAQNALVGGGYNTFVGCPDKGLYVTFLTWLNYFAGLNQNLVIIFQVIVFSIFPVLIYLIGKQINTRSLGVIAAFLAIFKESNAISSASIISTTMSKMMMSELPTAIFIVLFILFFIQWIKNKGQIFYLAGAMGGLIGLCTMLRLTVYIFVPMTLLVFGWFLFNHWKKLLISMALFLVVLFASILPWVVRIQVDCRTSRPFYYVMGPLNGVILDKRYNAPTVTPNAPASLATPQPTMTEAIPAVTQAGEVGQEQATPTPSGYKNDQFKNINSPIKPPGSGIIDNGWKKLGSVGDKLKFISAHFFHNLLTSVLILPTNIYHDDIEHIANPVDSFWADNWDGRIGWLGGILLSINLALIATGCATAWRKWKLAGILPGIVYLVYCLGLGIARTSGGRYIVPVDWILYLYYGGGWLIIIQGLSRIFGKTAPIENVSERINRVLTLKQQTLSNGLVLAVFLGVGLMLPGTEKIFPPQVYPPPDRQIVNYNLTTGGYDELQVTQSDVLTYSGRAINPRYFFYRQDIIPGGAVNFPLHYPRFVFTLLGKGTPMINVVLPSKQIPENINNGTVVSVAGCMNEHGFLDAVMVTYDQHIYYRYPMAQSLKCPIKDLVCNDDDRTCK